MTLIAENAGREGSVVVDAVRKAKDADSGWDAVTDEYVEHVRARHRRPGEGGALGAGERGVDRRDGADDGVADHATSRSRRLPPPMPLPPEY